MAAQQGPTQHGASRRHARAVRHAQVGDVIKGRYKILDLIGTGGMSRVYLAMDRQLSNKQWAVKEVDRSARDPAGRPIEQSLASEARLLSRLDHPSIVDIADIEVTDDFIYVIEDHVEGQTLAALVRQEGPQPETRVQGWMLQVCDALGYLHRQEPPIIYRDMKPSNIMLRPDGYIKLIDLGVAREYRDGARRDTVAFGTTGYAAPEQYGKAQSDARTDVYTIGATMWHLLAGEAPPVEFPLPDVRTRNPDVGEGFAEVIIPRCCALDRAERYQSCEELAADLAIYDELTREYRTRQRRKVQAFVACLVAAAVCLVVGLACLWLREAALEASYTELVGAAAASLQNEDYPSAKDAYAEAIELDPANPEAWLDLIEAYKLPEDGEEDGAFTASERAQLIGVYDSCASCLATEDLAEVSYQIGRLYWYYYSSESASSSTSDDTTGVRQSVGYFETAMGAYETVLSSFDEGDVGYAECAELLDKATIYYTIADFTSSIRDWQTTDDDSAVRYAAYWESLVDLAALAADESNETVSLQSYAVIVSALETYAASFEGAGIGLAAVAELLDVVRDGLGSLLIQSDADGTKEERRQSLLLRLDSAARNIELAYGSED